MCPPTTLKMNKNELYHVSLLFIVTRLFVLQRLYRYNTIVFQKNLLQSVPKIAKKAISIVKKLRVEKRKSK